MTKIKSVLKYIIIFVLVVLFLIGLQVVVAKIPRKYALKNLKEATNYFYENQTEVTLRIRGREYSYGHPFADQVILNMIYCLDSDHPLKSIVEAKYYQGEIENGDNNKYIKLIENDYEGNTQYMRYWHGSVVIIKPLIIFFTLKNIYNINAIVLITLTLILAIILIKHKQYKILIAQVIALVMIACWYIPYTFEYTWTFMIMQVVSIIAVNIEFKNKLKKESKLCILFFITGILTCFMDFLTTEIITILVPVAIVFEIRFKNNEKFEFKENFIKLIKYLIVWAIAYILMWVTKWILASIVLNVNSLDYVLDKAKYRINGQVDKYTYNSHLDLMFSAITYNFKCMFPFSLFKHNTVILIEIIASVAAVIIIFTDYKNKKKFSFALICLILFLLPIIRYIVLANHSFCHRFFVFRNQISSIMVVILVLLNCLDRNKMTKSLKKSKSKEKDK